jgi:hypothetical protein
MTVQASWLKDFQRRGPKPETGRRRNGGKYAMRWKRLCLCGCMGLLAAACDTQPKWKEGRWTSPSRANPDKQAGLCLVEFECAAEANIEPGPKVHLRPPPFARITQAGETKGFWCHVADAEREIPKRFNPAARFSIDQHRANGTTALLEPIKLTRPKIKS